MHSSLLLPAHDPAAPQSVLTGGDFEPGDRVVVVSGTGAPAFGSRGTVIGVMPTVVELLMDDEYAGEGGLGGPGFCWMPCVGGRREEVHIYSGLHECLEASFPHSQGKGLEATGWQHGLGARAATCTASYGMAPTLHSCGWKLRAHSCTLCYLLHG